MAVNKLGPVKRFGSRYGRTTRFKIDNIEKPLKTKQLCPFCKKEGVKRLFSGVWECRKCNSKFTGRAYEFNKKINDVEVTN